MSWCFYCVGFLKDGFYQILFFLWIGHTFPFLCMLCNFLLWTGQSEDYDEVSLEIWFLQCTGITDIYLLELQPSILTLPNKFCQLSILCCVWALKSICSQPGIWQRFLYPLSAKMVVPLNILIFAATESQEGQNQSKHMHLSLRAWPDQPKCTTPHSGGQGSPLPARHSRNVAALPTVLQGASSCMVFSYEGQHSRPSSSTHLIVIRVQSGSSWHRYCQLLFPAHWLFWWRDCPLEIPTLPLCIPSFL